MTSLVLYELPLAGSYLAARSEHYRSVALWVGVALLGSYTAFSTDQIFLTCLLLAVGGFSLAQSVPYSRRYWAAVEKSFATRPESRFHLEVGEDGLHETVEGIESFAPWTSVKRFTVFRDTWFIDLAAGLCAIVPRNSQSKPIDLDALVKILWDRGIEESPNQVGPANGSQTIRSETNPVSPPAGSRR